MPENDPPTGRKHLLTPEQLSSHRGVDDQDLTRGHRQGNGLRVHQTYILVVSIVALVLMVVAITIAVAMTSM